MGTRLPDSAEIADRVKREHVQSGQPIDRADVVEALEEAGRAWRARLAEVERDLHRCIDRQTAAELQLGTLRRKMMTETGAPVGFSIEESLILRERARAAGGRLVLMISGEQVGELVLEEAHTPACGHNGCHASMCEREGAGG